MKGNEFRSCSFGPFRLFHRIADQHDASSPGGLYPPLPRSTHLRRANVTKIHSMNNAGAAFWFRFCGWGGFEPRLVWAKAEPPGSERTWLRMAFRNKNYFQEWGKKLRRQEKTDSLLQLAPGYTVLGRGDVALWTWVSTPKGSWGQTYYEMTAMKFAHHMWAPQKIVRGLCRTVTF